MSDGVTGNTELDDATLKQMIIDSEEQFTKLITHPCEDVFDIEAGTTEVVTEPPRHTPLVNDLSYDDKDREIEENYQEIFDRAMDTFDDIQRDSEGIEGKYKARNHEVGAQFLNAALSAAKEKQKLKAHKDKMGDGPKQSGSDITNNTQINITTSTSDLVRQLQERAGVEVAQNLGEGGEEAIEAESVEVVEDAPKQRKTIKRSKKD